MASIGKAMAPFLAAAAIVALVVTAALGTPPEMTVSPVAAQTSTPTPTPAPPAKTPVAQAFQPLGNKLVRVFYFQNSTKSWLWYDPATPDVSTLAEMELGQSYWILVTETVSFELHGRTRKLTCANNSCWNLFPWS